MSHLSPGIIDGFIKNRDSLDHKDQYFLIYYSPSELRFGNFEEEWNKFKLVFDKYNYSNYRIINGDINLIKELIFIRNKNKLIIHDNYSIFGNNLLFILPLLFKGSHFLMNVSFVKWGVNAFKPQNKKENIFLNIEKRVYSKCRFIITLSEGDKEIIKQVYGLKNVIVSSYFPWVNYVKNKIFHYHKPLKIIVSHSGHIHNNHLNTFHLLEHLKDEDIEIWCPLCYGPSNYIKQVIKQGKNIFGNKFHYFDKLLEINDYITFIANSDVYISSAKCQTGLFAVSASLGNGLLVFLDSNLYNQFSTLGYTVFNTSALLNSNILKLYNILSNKQKISNSKKISQDYFLQERINCWRNVLE